MNNRIKKHLEHIARTIELFAQNGTSPLFEQEMRRINVVNNGLLVTGGWSRVEAGLPDDNSHVRVYHSDWRDEFTPTGTREAAFCNGEFIMGVWNPEQDCWDVAEDVAPTHWCYPGSPEFS